MKFIYTKAFAIFFICLAILAFLMFLNSRGALGQIQKFFLKMPEPAVKAGAYATGSIKSFFSVLYNLKQLSTENTELKNRVVELKTSLTQAEGDIRDNEILRKELGFKKTSKLSLVPCEVMSSNILNLTDTLVLNCGSDEGVKEGQVVMAQGHVVGKIIYTNKNTSTARLATSSKFLIDARVSKTGQSAVVEGSFSSGMLLNQIPQSAPLEKGWLIVTAGINSQVPKDLLIGEVGEVVSTSNDLFKKASLLTPVDFSNLQFVYVAQ
ncbi:MAG: rod shape-determining protein MreC [Candidatus Doudnabacteria bacterium]|nr:rod shape-determining protein MreC [Candidatus Doudnabacteria bacterium]